MSGRYVAFDVETPNFANDRISAIGVAVVEDGQIVREFAALVNPETHFDRFNVELTGITPERVAGEPTFAALWPVLEPLLGSGCLAAHNAPFDLAVLSRCLRAYGIRWRARVPYVCTCRLSRRVLPQLPNHKLSTVCAHLGIPLDHHRAGSDARACGEILRYCLGSGADVDGARRTYDLAARRTLPGRPAPSGTLVRDGIPALIESAGGSCRWETVSGDRYLRLLDEKLAEELAEFRESHTLEELADLQEVLLAAAAARGWTPEDVERARAEKAARRGGFAGGVFLRDGGT